MKELGGKELTKELHENQKKVIISKAESSDIEGICKVHIESFEGYFATLLGKKFLTIFYNHYLNCPENILIVAKRENGIICGFAAGTTDVSTFNKGFFWENLGTLIGITINKIITEKRIWHHIFEKRALLKEILKRNKSKNKFYNKDHLVAVVYSIAVLKEFRGTGVAMDLLNTIANEIEKKGVGFCRLGTYLNNKRAINFYKKAKWEIEKETDKDVIFIKRFKSKNK